MRVCLSVIVLLFFSATTCFAQPLQNIAGTWYAKSPDRLQGDSGLIVCYSRNEVTGYTKKLSVGKDYKYTCSEFTNGAWITTTGKLFASSDTIHFAGDQSRDISSAFLYVLDKDRLIYAVLPPAVNPKIITEVPGEDFVFTPVRISAAYEPGNRQLVKAMYKELAASCHQHPDSVSVYTCRFVVYNTGKPDLSRLEVIPGQRTDITAGIKKALAGLPGKFTPRQEGGRAVHDRYVFTIVY